MAFDVKRGTRHARRAGAQITRTGKGIVVGEDAGSAKVATGLKELGYVERQTRTKGGGMARTLVKLSAAEVDLKVLEFVQDMDAPHNPLYISNRLGIGEVAVTRSLERLANKVPNLHQNGNRAWRWDHTPAPTTIAPVEPPTADVEPPAASTTPPELPAPTEPLRRPLTLSGNNQGTHAVTEAVMPWMEAHPDGRHNVNDIAAALGMDPRKVGSALSYNHRANGKVEIAGKGYWRWAGPRPAATISVLLPAPPSPVGTEMEDWSVRSHWDKVLMAMAELDAWGPKHAVMPTALDKQVAEHHTALPDKVPAQLFMFALRKMKLVEPFGERWYLTDKYREANRAQLSMYLDDLLLVEGPHPGSQNGARPAETRTATMATQGHELVLTFVGVSPMGQLYRAGDAYYLVSQFVVP